MHPEREQARWGTERNLGPSQGRARTLESWEWEGWPMKGSEAMSTGLGHGSDII